MGPQIKTFSLVTVIAALIWIWAEGESFSSVVVNPRVTFVVDQTDLLFTTDESWRGTVRLRLEGSTVAIKQAERSLGSNLRLRPGQPGVPVTAGERQAVNLVEALRSLPEVKSMGITVVDVDPPDAIVSVTRFVSKDLPVRAQFPPEIVLAGEPTLTPSKIVVRMPEQLASKLTESDFAVVSIDAEILKNARDDAPQTFAAPVRLPSAMNGTRTLEVTPDRISVTFRLKKNVDTHTLTSVPVWVAVPPTETMSWDIEVTAPFLTDVKFTGPTDVVKRLRDGTLAPIAELRLTSDELENGIESKEAMLVGLPPGLEYVVANRVVKLVIKRRATDKSAPNGPSGIDANGSIPPDS